MKASRNELIALFKQAFEGVGFDFGGYESAADMIVWAEMHGLHSFKSIRNRMPVFEQRKRILAEQLVPVYRENAIIDAKRNSSIVAAGMAFDIAYVRAIHGAVAKVTVINCYDRKLAIKKLVDCANRDVVCLAYWRDGEILHVVHSDTGFCCPEYSQYKLEDVGISECFNEEHQQTLFVICAKDVMGMQEYMANNVPELKGNKTVVISPLKMKLSYTEALTNGIVIDSDFWKELTILGQEVLVESTEQSRMGAGA
jgi:LDH2 family malate/lactate/ureidoglycolate dehydrogenase